MENNIFNHSKIYSQENANILEALLERKVVPFIEIVSIFFPNRVAELDIDSYLADLIQTEAIHPVINDMLSLNIPLCFFTREYFYFQFGVIWGKYYITNIGEPESKIYTDNIISLLIQNGDLPEAIRRLPKLANKEILSAYYDDLLDYKSSTDEEIIFCEANYCPSEPRTLTHFESIKLLAEHGLEESLLRNIPLYLRVKGEYVRNNRQLRQSSNFTLLREANCGNASYKKRYKDIERLHDETSDNLYQGQIIRIKTSDRIYQRQAIHIKTIGIEKIKNGDGNHTYGTSIARSLEVQTTDLETKFHLKRQIISCGQRMPDGTYRNQFELKNTCRLREDVEALILEHTSKIQISEQSETTNFLDISIDCPRILSKENKADVAQKSLLQPARKRTRSEQHPLFLSYATNYAKEGASYRDYEKMMSTEELVFKNKAEYLTKANDDNTDNISEFIKHVALVHGVTKKGNPKYDIYYKPVLSDGESLGRAKVISARCAETYFSPKKRK